MINVEETKTEIKQEPVQEISEAEKKYNLRKKLFPDKIKEETVSQTLRNPYTGELETDTNKIKEVKNE